MPLDHPHIYDRHFSGIIKVSSWTILAQCFNQCWFGIRYAQKNIPILQSFQKLLIKKFRSLMPVIYLSIASCKPSYWVIMFFYFLPFHVFISVCFQWLTPFFHDCWQSDLTESQTFSPHLHFHSLTSCLQNLHL